MDGELSGGKTDEADYKKPDFFMEDSVWQGTPISLVPVIYLNYISSLVLVIYLNYVKDMSGGLRKNVIMFADGAETIKQSFSVNY